ncbi:MULTISPECIES: hypothetical protein [Vibrio]|uniref:hypothetical protein n=1 Tax=Vibrio TaxID=662 RepID=UPI000C1627F4|nr:MULTISPECIES: hypothetical protein [Vibrio]NAW69295.1 hypothetical protein [Vibrio sp. V28_P6S34P95]NAX05656.1 hypothetical protein [Vibrio sp. V30_P3S12P165]NAX33649.1 hypothetical protein [Vibrio sp. V29_P1S30P107]NAX38361.1 hypothetical protein [Vibrio sp. V27_P1S3P104]NAX41373.1 hypothetical protein [Vibrio sp. V26_P1S5P106]
MYRFLVTTLTLVCGLFALIFSLLLAIPLMIVALITGKRLEKQLKRRPFHQAKNNENSDVIEGEFEEVSRRDQHSDRQSDEDQSR